MAALTGAVVAALVGFGACKSAERLPPPQPGTGGAGQGGAGGDLLAVEDSGPPPLDAPNLCGNQLHQIISEVPNVYFVIDASGSMGALTGNSTRFAVVRKAAVSLVRDLGPLINVGAALFPQDATDDDPCPPGAQVMAVLPGDPYSDAEGPTTNKFKHKIDVTPFGGTPTAATLEKLRPGLKALPGKTLVLLVTDGGPNCNATAACGASECQANIEGCTGFTCCDPGGNCCKPEEPWGPEACVDRPATLAAMKAFAEADIPVYVIGIPGSETYAAVLEEMAIAAGTAQVAKPFYYRVDDVDNLTSVLGGIAAVAISCIFTIEDPPKEDNQTNVYLNGTVLPADLQNGWRWMDPDLTRIELLGDACNALKTGKVKSVQIVSGCPTEPPK
jgi:hypothetical protein